MLRRRAQGMRLNTEVTVPEQFLLLLNRAGSVRRECQLVWQSKLDLGVRFVFSPATAP